MSSPERLISIKKSPVDLILQPFQEFTRFESFGGILLLLATFLALIVANSPLYPFYNDFLHIIIQLGLGDFIISKPVYLWVNDLLMAIFFFVVGLEIKREIMFGELSTVKKSVLPVMAAIGGMVLPAVIFIMLNAGKPGAEGWGIPMATDIAFALGILALVGKGVPLSVKVFLTALAIIDDIGAVLVIAVFYTDQLSIESLIIGFIFLMISVIGNRLGIKNVAFYMIIGVILWVAFLKSGIHATIAGVLLAMTIPGRSKLDTEDFEKNANSVLDYFRKAGNTGKDVIPNDKQSSAIQALETVAENAESPMHRLEHQLHPWVAYFIMPIFAFANAGVVIEPHFFELVIGEVSLGIIFGLIVGKVTGITLFSWISIKTGIAEMPSGANWIYLVGASSFAGIGFTMSMFISNLAYPEGDLLTGAKAGILIASFIAAILGSWLIGMASKNSSLKPNHQGA